MTIATTRLISVIIAELARKPPPGSGMLAAAKAATNGCWSGTESRLIMKQLPRNCLPPSVVMRLLKWLGGAAVGLGLAVAGSSAFAVTIANLPLLTCRPNCSWDKRGRRPGARSPWTAALVIQ